LGIEADVLPWEKDKLLKAISKCFRSFLDEVNHDAQLCREAELMLQDGLRSLDLPEKRTGMDLAIGSKSGFWESTPKGKLFAIRSTVFSEFFPDRAHENAALRQLRESKRLRLRGSEDGVRSNGKEWAISYPKWSRTKNFRAIQFFQTAPSNPATAHGGGR
jgi:hypothetical protein